MGLNNVTKPQRVKKKFFNLFCCYEQAKNKIILEPAKEGKSAYGQLADDSFVLPKASQSVPDIFFNKEEITTRQDGDMG